MGDIILVGAGPVGIAACRLATQANGFQLIAIVDPDDNARTTASEEFAGVDLHSNIDQLPHATSGAVALLTFASSRDKVVPSLTRLLSLGHNIVTTCEGLAYPPRDLHKDLQKNAEGSGKVVVVTGANPGFAMDRLPVVLAHASYGVTRVAVTRHVDTSTRRAPLIAKTGLELPLDEFDHAVAAGRVGHAGLKESLRLIAESLGWDQLEVEEQVEPIAAADNTVAGISQVARGITNGNEVILRLKMGWELQQSDRIAIDGNPPIRVQVDGGYDGDLGTAAQVVNAIEAIPRLSAGFFRPTDLPI